MVTRLQRRYLEQLDVRRIERLLMEDEETCVSKSPPGSSSPGFAVRPRDDFASSDHDYLPPASESAGGPEFADFSEKLKNAIMKQIGRYQRLSSPGPSGSRVDHWGSLRWNESGMQAAGFVWQVWP